MSRFTIDFLDEYTPEKILEEIQRVAAMHGAGPLSRQRFDQLSGRLSTSTIVRRFDTWQNALECAGVGHLYAGKTISQKMRVQAARALTEVEIVAELRRVHQIVGDVHLTRDTFNTVSSLISDGAVRSRFGSWGNALAAAGIPQSESANKNWTNENCWENLAVVWTHYGRVPRLREMDEPPSLISGRAYEYRWGTWRKALRAFVEWTQWDSYAEPTISEAPIPVRETEVIEHPAVMPAEADRREVRPRLRFQVFQRDRFRCVGCGRSPATHLNVILHADHIVPVAVGGKTIIENLQALCEDCNLGKGTMTM